MADDMMIDPPPSRSRFASCRRRPPPPAPLRGPFPCCRPWPDDRSDQMKRKIMIKGSTCLSTVFLFPIGKRVQPAIAS